MIQWIILLVFSTVVRGTLRQEAEEDVVSKCVKANLFFTSSENYFARPATIQNSFLDVTPVLIERPFPELEEIKDIKGIRQRTFECIGETLKTNIFTSLALKANYEKLVTSCKSQEPAPKCRRSHYRTIDGTCNNLKNPTWGSTMQCLRRLIPAYYEDVSGFRRSVCGGGPLPEPRFLSVNFHSNKNRPSHKFTSMFPFFGQLIAHDITDVAITSVANMSIDCCKSENPKDLHPQCAPIRIPRDDPFYSEYNITCFNFIRAAPCDSCSIGKRDQMNEVTSLFDGSVIYGSSVQTQEQLRAKNGTGKLIYQNREAGELLPPNPALNFLCGSQAELQYCFRAGDRRVNQQTMLMALQTLFLRFHNKIAEELKRCNPKWSEEKLYQETRKIIIAILQIIAYKEFLPLVIGKELMAKYDLSVLKKGWTRYNPKVDATMLNEFNTAAYRLHSTINGQVIKHPLDGGTLFLRDMFSRVAPIYNDQMDSLMTGACQYPAQKYDRYVSRDLAGFVYRRPGQAGGDIAAFNIQRGRDNGLPPYVKMILYLTNGKVHIKKFDDLRYRIDSENIALLKKLYCHVDDIDLWVGMNSERVPGGMFVGQTAAEIIAIQFHKLKFGDRFFCENDGQFTKAQLKSLRKMTFTKVLCENTDICGLQRNAFLLESDSNPSLECDDIPGLDIELWKD